MEFSPGAFEYRTVKIFARCLTSKASANKNAIEQRCFLKKIEFP